MHSSGKITHLYALVHTILDLYSRTTTLFCLIAETRRSQSSVPVPAPYPSYARAAVQHPIPSVRPMSKTRETVRLLDQVLRRFNELAMPLAESTSR